MLRRGVGVPGGVCSVTIGRFGLLIARVLHALSQWVLGAVALALLASCVLATAGVIPWIEIAASVGGAPIPQAGMALQVALTVFACLLVFFLPGNARILALENSHRQFHVSMEDVARAYWLCHTADRKGVFTLSSEFDAVRERIAFLRDHPDLGQLESGVLTLAAQMSQQAHRLAEVYSDEKVARARDFLAQRQKEAEDQQARIIDALHICREIRRWADQVEIEEAVVQSQLQQLDEQLQRALPALGYDFESEALPQADNVVALNGAKPAAKPAAE